jgi:hypothetical protein
MVLVFELFDQMQNQVGRPAWARMIKKIDYLGLSNSLGYTAFERKRQKRAKSMRYYTVRIRAYFVRAVLRGIYTRPTSMVMQ